MTSTPAARGGPRSLVVELIGGFKLIKAVALVGMGVVAILLTRDQPAAPLVAWVHALALDPGNRYLNWAIARVARADERTLEELGVGSFLYAALFAVEGVGLLRRRRWAEILTVVITTSFLPLEVWAA